MAKAAKKGIPIITLERDLSNVSRQSFVGVSGYELGGILGGLVYDAVGPTGNALVVLDGASRGAAENTMLSSLQEKIQQYPGLLVQAFVVGSGGASNYDERVRRRILEDRSLDAIVCLNVEDTIRVAQTVVELNRIGRISIIAFRESDEIYDYVRKGIVRAVVIVDAKQMGWKAAEAMMEYLSTGHANDYVITEMHVVTRDTVDAEASANAGGGE
jgi:ribose transport system substrate-binding protein